MINEPPIPKRRPTKFTTQTRQRILELAEMGMPFSKIADAVGIATQSLIHYRKRSPAFEMEIQSAIARGIEKHLKKIQDAAEAGEWRASCWYLERCHNKFFGKNTIELQGADGSSLALNISLYLPQKEKLAVVEAQPLTIEEEATDGN